ncbi:hypothetical protein [Psychroflexus sp. MES1-P1E]|uniref:hypothetical protein n=1 Tax=Psychroflexus sp. MES1-P1E TaxID=2058320 RepID=UPI0015E1352B|nr:hypothetical protein [Psychroflexus sp. MES1-P1E]
MRKKPLADRIRLCVLPLVKLLSQVSEIGHKKEAAIEELKGIFRAELCHTS